MVRNVTHPKVKKYWGKYVVPDMESKSSMILLPSVSVFKQSCTLLSPVVCLSAECCHQREEAEQSLFTL